MISGERIVTPVLVPKDFAVPVAGVCMAAEHQRRTAAITTQHADGLMRAGAASERHLLQFDLEVPLP